MRLPSRWIPGGVFRIEECGARGTPLAPELATMIESNSAEVGSRGLTDAFSDVRTFTATLEFSRSVALVLVVAAALFLRTFGLGASGFSEDEINKLNAAAAYSRGDFSANAEHPMVMKLAVWGSLAAARRWNAHLPAGSAALVSDEAALRLPNALAGAAIAAMLFLIGEQLFDTTIGAFSAMFWALDPNAIAINRIAKEDTLLLMFLLLATHLYERGKAVPAGDPAVRDAWYRRSAIPFGLMLASKYMPHYFGLHAVFNIAGDQHPEDKTPDKRWPFFLVMAAVFVLANFAILLPSTWHYVEAYVHGDTLRHSGYTFAGRVYVNNLDASPWGLPVWFYAAFLATKAPLALLAAAAIGLAWVWRHPRHRGAAFVRVFLVFTLLPYSLAASKFLRYMLPMLAVIDIAAGVGLAKAVRRAGDAGPALALAVLALVGAQAVSAAPFYGLTRNAVGDRIGGAPMFPDDELYDAGVREAIAAIAPVAARDSVVCSDATAVVREYLARSGRNDVEARSIAHDGLPMHANQVWVLVQDGHTYFENAAVIDALRRRLTPWTEIRVAGISAVRVYRFQ